MSSSAIAACPVQLWKPWRGKSTRSAMTCITTLSERMRRRPVTRRDDARTKTGRPAGARIARGVDCYDRARRPDGTSNAQIAAGHTAGHGPARRKQARRTCATDRKSTRLNSSHQIISYAVFCLKKKKQSNKKDIKYRCYV